MEEKHAVSAIIYNSKGFVLVARRTPTKFPFPNILSLPSSYINQGENPELKLISAVKRKLGIDIIIKGAVGTKKGAQANYLLSMTDYFAKIIGGTLQPNQEDYSEAMFVNPIKTFGKEDRSKMGFCTQVLLEAIDKNPDFWKKYI